jgi:hypothetical protein
MFQPLPYQLCMSEHGISGAEQRAADVRAGEAAAALRDLRLHFERIFRPWHRVRSARGTADTMTPSARVLSNVR